MSTASGPGVEMWSGTGTCVDIVQLHAGVVLGSVGHADFRKAIAPDSHSFAEEDA
eukprot:COSAG02_NODE_2080_length_9901_cov_103.580086_3_plen_55_part_00